MYFLSGAAQAIANVYTVTHEHQQQRPRSLADLRSAYLSFLSSYQPTLPLANRTGIFVESEKDAQRLSSFFRADSSLNDRQQSRVLTDIVITDVQRTHQERIAQALQIIKEKAPPLHQVFALVIHSIFFRQSSLAIAGSTASAIGAIWFAGTARMQIYDYLELLLHELTHCLLFIDELRYSHFNYALIKMPKNFAQSSLLKIKRPLDKVVHSIIVACEIAAAREACFGHHACVTAHPQQAQLLANARDAIASCKALPNLSELATARICHLIDAAQDKIAQLWAAAGATV